MQRSEAMEKARELLARMTVEEKVAQMVQVPYSKVGREEALRWARLGAGSFLHVLGDDAREVQETALHTRLGIPVIFGIDAIHGHGLNEHATIFPSQLAMACSWDRDMTRRMGEVTAREVATDGLHWTFSPVLCLGRDTRWGRIDETFGEDPYLAGELGEAIIRGYQGDDLDSDEHILACAKHYLGYGEATGARDAYDTEITRRKAREVFLPPFRKAVEAGCATIMTAYGSQDGVPYTVNSWALRDMLRGEMDFSGFVVTDWDNARSLVERQHVCATLEEAAVEAAKAGNDMIMTTLAFYDAMLAALKEGSASMDVVDEAVLHILTIKYEMGLFHKSEKTGVPGCIGCDAHHDQALQAARGSMTLLKNNGMLPLKKNSTIALIGPNADDIRAQYGDWTYFTHPEPGIYKEPVRPYVTLKEGLEQLCTETGSTCLYMKGCGQLAEDTDDLDGAVALAQKADVIVFVPGDCARLFGEYQDRANLELSGRQTELFRRLRALNKPICTVLISSKPLCLGDSAEKADAVLCAFNPGMYGGQAIAETLFGCINPSGHLPISFPRHSGQVPVYYNHLPGWHGDKYVDLPGSPLFAFGEGLSYTQFVLSRLALDADTLTVCGHVENTGHRDGDALIQVYVRDLVSSVITPVKQLRSFLKVPLAAGEGTDFRIALKPEDFALVNALEQTVVEPGDFQVLVGFSSKDEDLTALPLTLPGTSFAR